MKWTEETLRNSSRKYTFSMELERKQKVKDVAPWDVYKSFSRFFILFFFFCFVFLTKKEPRIKLKRISSLRAIAPDWLLQERFQHLLIRALNESEARSTFPCGLTGTPSGNCQGMETIMVWACHVPRLPLQNHPSGTLEGGQCHGLQKNCWMDNIREWILLPSPELLIKATYRKD